jgi:hypothetical protein
MSYNVGWNLSWMVLLMDLIGSMESEIQRLLEENNKLKNICNETVFSHKYFIDNNGPVPQILCWCCQCLVVGVKPRLLHSVFSSKTC